MLSKKINFAVIITAEYCNPNGDPIQMNMPRQDLNGYGEITDVCIKRKIRNRLQDMGENILGVAMDRATDGMSSIKERVDSCSDLKKNKKNPEEFYKIACEQWIDVRSFGQVFPYKGTEGVTIGIRGPVSIGIARTLEPIAIEDIQITKSYNLDPKKDGAKDATTMSTKYIVEKGVYVAYGSISPQLAEKTGFSDDDAEKIRYAMETIFEGDYSSARPAGSMNAKLYWWEQKIENKRIYSPIEVHRSLNIRPISEYPYYECDPQTLKNVELRVFPAE